MTKQLPTITTKQQEVLKLIYRDRLLNRTQIQALLGHKDAEEIMVVLKDEGLVADEDGEYSYAPGDVIIFPPNAQHKVVNNSNEEHEVNFVRAKV